MRLLLLCPAFLLLSAAFGQIPRLESSNGHHTLFVDGHPFLILGGQVHNSSAWPALLPNVWTAAAQLHLNTVEAPVYWEQLEPQQNKFDFAVVDTLLEQARTHQLRLVLLWFGTWKNGSNHYMPLWMKQEAKKYPNVSGKKGQPIDSPSPHSEATLDADIKAFAAFMRHLKAADPQHTVIMVQVENESGAWGSVRDYSPEAQKLFTAQVPKQLLQPELLNALKRPIATKGTWTEVFGDRADEYFHAWHVATFIGKVAAAGKAEYPLPLYVNAALRDPLTDPMADSYESGGPTDNVIPIWKTAAPAISLLAPDIYLGGSDKITKVIELYSRPDNALFIPEIGLSPDKAKYFYSVLARGGIGFSPFGIDDDGNTRPHHLEPFAANYEVAAPMMPQLAQWSAAGKIKAAVEHEDHAAQSIDLGSWQALIHFGLGERETLQPNQNSDGKIMVVQLGENEFLVIGDKCHLIFQPAGTNTGKAWQYARVEEGSYEKGEWKLRRILNGDETDWGGPHFGPQPRVLHITLVAR
jgi:beta-galactosidase GanA